MRLFKYFPASVLLLTALFGSGCTSNPPTPTTSQASVPTPAPSVSAPTFDEVTLESITRNLFDNVDLKKYSEAYGFFSESFRNSHPFQEWKDGYKNTLNHSISSVLCENGSCIADVVATEVTKDNLRKQRYVLRYDFAFDTSNYPVIDHGTLLTNTTTEVLTNFNETQPREEIPTTTQIPAIQEQIQPTSAITPESSLTPSTPTLTPVVSSPPPSVTCCKVCTKGKACGNSCISRNYTCHQPPGCACDAY